MTIPLLEKLAGRPLLWAPKPGGLMLATAQLDPAAGDHQATCPGPFEYFQAFSATDAPILVDGRVLVLYRGECHGKGRIGGLFHRSTVVWVLDPQDRLLVPTRSPAKDLNGGLPSVSMGEHNKVGEGAVEAALRGAREELGLDLKAERLSLVGTLPLRAPEQWQITTYLACRLDEGEEQALQLAPDEFSNQAWVPLAELVARDPVKFLNFRPDQAVALRTFLDQLRAGHVFGE